jgi:cell division protein FtsA
MLLGMRAISFGSGDITDAIASAFGIRRYQAERLKCMAGSALASPADHREMIPVNAPGDPEHGGPMARHADDKNRIPRAELVSVVTQQLGYFTDEIGRALKALGFSGKRGQQVVLTGGGAQLPGLADYAQAALGRPVRIGAPPTMLGLPPGHATPSSSTLVGLMLYAAADPVDIRSVGPSWGPAQSYRGLGLVSRVYRAMREYF